ncbi:MAG TPA: PilN domain-containing protein [Tepidisphaeraceae bacterium]|nr:PilN domain-containing protein [Tepidisphaeraceae bacterium]
MTTESEQFSFLPDDYCDRSVRNRLNAAATSILAILAIATMTALYVAEQSLRHVKRHNAEITRCFDQAVLRGGQVIAVKDESERYIERAHRIAALTAGIPSSAILAELTRALPPDISLTSLSVQPIPRPQAPSLAPTAFDLKKAALESRRRVGPEPLPDAAPTDIVLKLSGFADSNAAVSRLCDTLSRSGAFEEVRLIASEIDAGAGKEPATTRRFQIEATLNPAADPRQAPNEPPATSPENAGDRSKENP